MIDSMFAQNSPYHFYGRAFEVKTLIMDNQPKGVSSGQVFTTCLLVVFVVLKLVGTVNWSWWWVLSPFWIPIVLLVLVLILIKIFKQ